ncbi:MAG: hypothetical protein M3177_08245 [Pseudomonadota bacterium]|nr:hypothetical protein [Pseudomonadota bacterium]
MPANVAAEPDNASETAPQANAVSPAQANQVAAEAPVQVPEDAPGLAAMSPYQRRAWEKGYRDCSVGRYEPDPHPEAYRIGCGEAQERQAAKGGE